MEGIETASGIGAATVLAKPLVEQLTTLVKKLLGPPTQELAGLLADHVHGWRCENRVRILEKTKRLIDSAGVDPRVLPKGFLVPLLEKAGDVEDETLQGMWARLLAGAITDENSAQQIFTDTLSRLSPMDAQFILANAGMLRSKRPLQIRGSRGVLLGGVSTGRPRDEVAIVGRLAALGIVEFSPQYGLRGESQINERLSPTSMQVQRQGAIDTFFELSPFGQQLLDVVAPAVTEQKNKST